MSNRGRPRVMIVDDDERNIKAMRFALAKRGADVVSVRGVDEALRKSDEGFDVIVTDIVIGGEVAGFGLLDAFRRRKSTAGVPRIVATDYGAPADAARAKGLGALAYIMKADTDLSAVVDAVVSAYVGEDNPNHPSG